MCEPAAKRARKATKSLAPILDPILAFPKQDSELQDPMPETDTKTAAETETETEPQTEPAADTLVVQIEEAASYSPVDSDYDPCSPVSPATKRGTYTSSGYSPSYSPYSPSYSPYSPGCGPHKDDGDKDADVEEAEGKDSDAEEAKDKDADVEEDDGDKDSDVKETKDKGSDVEEAENKDADVEEDDGDKEVDTDAPKTKGVARRQKSKRGKERPSRQNRTRADSGSESDSY
jgi:hypothetical protein